MEEFKLTWGAHGTLDEVLMGKCRDVDPKAKLQSANNIITTETIEVLDNANKLLLEYCKVKSGHINYDITYVGYGFIANAGDSIITRFSREFESYSCDLRASMFSDGQLLRFEVEDNGVGMDKETEARIFQQVASSKACAGNPLRGVLSGRCGHHMKDSKKIVEVFDGKIGFTNKGLNKGALFWYEVPLDKIIQK
jgi:hypothetical protein